MRKFCILLIASLALAATCLGQSAPTSQPDSGRIKPPTATNNTSTGGSSAAANSLEEMLIAREKEVWELIKKKNAQAFAAYLAEDMIYVTTDGVHTKAETVKGIAEAGPPEVMLSDWKVMMIDKDAAIVTYTTKSGPVVACGPEPMTQRESTVWVKRGGKWLAVLHQDTPAKSGM